MVDADGAEVVRPSLAVTEKVHGVVSSTGTVQVTAAVVQPLPGGEELTV